MSESPQTPDSTLSDEDKNAMLFMQMVFQLSSLATLLLGKVPHPETGETRRDLESAQVVIDQLEMLQIKTRGNLNHDEEQLLKQTLMSLRMAYVDAVKQPEPESDKAQPASSAPKEPAAESTPPADPGPSDAGESKKRFTKKY